MKQRSTKATNRVDLWVDFRRTRVRIAHTAASVETIKRVLRDQYVSMMRRIQFLGLWSADNIEAGVSRLAFWLRLTKYALCGLVHGLGDVSHSSIWTHKHAQGRDERNYLEQAPEGEEDVPEHRKVLS